MIPYAAHMTDSEHIKNVFFASCDLFVYTWEEVQGSHFALQGNLIGCRRPGEKSANFLNSYGHLYQVLPM